MNNVKRAFIVAFAAVFAFVAPAVAANVAKIGDVEYATIDAAVAAWKPGEMIELLTDIERDSYFVFTQNTYALDGKGHTIKCTKAHSKSWKYFVNVNAGTQTFKNIIIDGNGKVPFVMQAIDGGKLILENVTIKGAKTTTTGSLFSRSTSLGYGIHVNDGSVEAKNITITNCEVADVYQDGASSSFTLSGDNCNVNFIGSSSAKESVTSTAKGYYAYEVTYKSNLGNGTAKTISNKALNGIIDQVQKSITTIVATFPVSVEIKSATVKLLQDVVLAEAFTSNDTRLTINGNGKTITGTFKFSSTPSPISSAVIGNGSVLDCTASTKTGFSGVSVAANATIDILLPSTTDISKYSLPVALGANAIANITVGDKKYIAKGDVITPAETLAQVGDKQYATLQAAIDAANGSATVHVLKDVALTSSLTVPEGKTLTLNLAGRKVTVSGADYALVNNGNLTIVDMGLVTVVAAEATIGDETAAPILIMAPSANDGVAVIDDATGGSIAGVKNNGTFTLESGAVVAASASVPAIDNTANAVATITGGTVEGKLQAADKTALTITGGSFTGNSNVSDFVGGNYGVDDNGTVISYVAQLGATKYQTLQGAFAAAKEFDVVTVLDAEADVSGIAGYVAEGLFPISNGDKTYTIRAMPAATVEKLPAFTLTKARDAYMCWPEGDTEIDRPLDIVMNFLANDDGKAEANETGFADWKCDFYLTFSDMAGASLEADGCYLAGNYGGFGWIVIPADDTIIDNNATLPVVAAYDANITYRQVCDTVKKFTAAIHVADAVMTANPDLKITLQLKMTNNKDASQELVVGSYTYTIDDIKGEFKPTVKVEDGATVTDTFKATVGSGLANAYQATEGKLNVTVVEQAASFATIDVSADGYEVPAEGLEMTFPAQSVKDNNPAIIVHKHEGKYYVTTGLVEYGFVKYNNTLGFSEFIVGDVAALNAALAEGGEVILSSDIVLTETLTIPAGKTVTLDLNGKQIASGFQKDSTTKHIYPFDVSGTFTIKDTVGNGSITGRGIFVQDGSKLTIESGAVYAIDSNGGSVLYQYGGDIVINGGHIEQKAEGTYNFAINGLGGTVTVNNGWVGGNHGAIAAGGAAVVLNGGTFVCTGTAGMTDNVLYSYDTGSITINGGTFTGDSDAPAGGCCVYDANGGATINGGTFGNTSGGDVWGTTGTTIKGGTFSNLIETQHIAVGYELNADGQVVAKPAVAKIGDTPYATLAEAVAAANEITDEQVTITMLADAEFGGDDLYANLVLDLSGKTITATGSYVFWFEGGSLLVKDSSTEKTGKIDGSASVGNVFLLMGEESLTIESGIIHANNNVIYTYGSGVNVTINGGELKSVIATGNIFYLVGANDTIVVNNGTFIGNVNPYAAGLSIRGGQFTVDVTSYCAPGYKAQKNTATGYYEVVEDRVETVDPSVAQAKIVLGGEEKYYATLADAVKAAQNESVTDLVITLMGETTATTAVSFNLSYKTVFNSVTFKQADATQPYFIKELYTGARMNDGAFIFDGVNIKIPSNGQYMFEGNVKLINNSTITSKADANCFVYYANVTIEPGSKLNGVIDDIRGGTLTVDGGKTDGTVNSTPDLQDIFLYVNWADSKLVVKNGAYVKINSVNEIGTLTVNGAVEVSNAKLEVLQEIAISQNASMKVDAGSEINAGKITGAGKIIVDATGMSAGDEISLTANLANFTGTLETVGNDDLEASIVDGKIILSAKPVAKIGDTNYETLADAFAEAKDGDTITLLGNCELVSGIDIDKNISVDGAGYRVYAADIADDTEMFNIRSKVTITNLIFDADHKFSYGIQVQDAADVTLSDVCILYAGNDNWGAAVNLNGGKLFVSGDFTAFSGGENGGAFPFTGILYWGGDFKFADGATASIADPIGATTDSDLLLVGTVGLLSIEDADAFLSQFNIPSGFAPYTLALDADIVSSFGGFTGASPLPWNTIIDYGKQILDAIGESTTETQVTVGLLDDTVIPDVFVYEDANFSINGNGKTLTGTIDVTDNVGTISNVVLTSGTTFVMTNVTTGCVKFGDNVTVSGQVTIVPPANYGVGSAPLIEFTDGSGVKPEDFVIDQSAVEIPEGAEFVVDGNKIVLGTPVAKIGEVKYASLLSAIAAAKSGDTVTLLGDCGITTGIILNKNITIDGGSFTLTAVSGDPSLAQMVKIESAATIKNTTLAVNHKYDYGIQMNNPASDLTLENVTILYAGKAEGHKNGELLFGASVFLQQGNLLVKGKFTAFSGGETAGTFPFTGILYWPAGDPAPTFRFDTGATASISDPTGATSDSDLLLVGAPGILSVGEADLMLSAFNIPEGFAPYTLKLDCPIVQGVGGGFTGASPLAWNTIIDYGKKILTVVNESTTETQVEVGILDDVEIPEVFVYEDANFSINGNGKVLSGTIDFTDNVGTIKNVELTSDMTFVMTNVTEGCVKLGEGVIITAPVKVIPPDNFRRGKDSATLIEFAEGSGMSLEKFEIDTSTVQLPEGSQIVQDGNKIIVKLPIAQVGNRKFATLAEAFEAANDGDTVRVLYSFSTNETIVINKAITFDFRGDVITNTASGAAIQVAAVGVKFVGGELVAKGDGIVVAEGGSSVIERGVYEVTGDALAGSVTVSGGTFNKPANDINRFKSDDSEAVDNDDGWCMVMDYVAQFGEEKYVFLQDAINAAAATNPTVENPATVTLLGNVAGLVTLPDNVIISANGYTVQSVVDSVGHIVELHGGAYQVGSHPEPPPIRSIKIVGDKVQLSFVPRKDLAWVRVLSTTDLPATTWTSEKVDVTGAAVGKEFIATVDKPDGNNAFFKIEFAYSE